MDAGRARFGVVWLATSLLVSGLLLGSCGGDEVQPVQPAEEPAGAPAPTPAEAPGLVLTFKLDVEAARAAGLVSKDADPMEVMRHTIAVVRQRLRAYGLRGDVPAATRPDRFQVRLPVLEAEEQAAVVDLITRSGRLEFRIEVKPDEVYIQQRAGDERDPPGRLGVWPQRDRASFESFVHKETEVWRAAAERGELYEPSDLSFRLVKAHGTDGTSSRHFHLLEEADPGFPLDGRLLQNPVLSVGQMNQPVVVFDIRPEHQDAFGAWTEKNVGLPLAIVLEGVWRMAPVIQDKLTRNVQISLGMMGSRAEREREAKALATVLQTGALPVAPVLLSSAKR